jgi:predicted HTH transcriptional regulator
MDNDKEYTFHGLEEYIRQGEPQQQERGKAWQTAIGLQQVDGLNTSPYLLETARRHIEGDITINQAKQLIDSYYLSKRKGNKELKKSQSANIAPTLPPKCKNCTLEEIAVLNIIQQDPHATQTYIASQIKKSERTIKSITARLVEQGILKRVNGKRNGYWEIS